MGVVCRRARGSGLGSRNLPKKELGGRLRLKGEKMISFQQLISLTENKPSDLIINGNQKNTKIMFHKLDKKQLQYNPKYNILGFENYQKEHWNLFFANTEYVFSFWYEGKTAKFIGCYKMNQCIKDKTKDQNNEGHDRLRFPDMQRIDFMNEYSNRLYIEWTNPSANYGRFIDQDKFIVHAISTSKDNSVGSLPKEFFQIHINYQELKKMIDYPIDNQEWFSYLSSRCGVYLIYDKETKEQYIGSAYGELGFWGRWSNYASQNDGNQKFFGRNYTNLIFSILWETLPNQTKERIINVETHFKDTMGTRVHGLNNN